MTLPREWTVNLTPAIAPFSQLPAFAYFASILEKIKSLGNTQDASATMAKNILLVLADDDTDDRELFEEVIKEINSHIKINMVEDGLQLMDRLHDGSRALPDLLFLDLNMPGKNGKQCLQEIKADSRLKNIPVVIYSTSGLIKDINETHSGGASLYIRKSNSYTGAVTLIKKAFSIDLENCATERSLTNFVLSADKA